MNTCCPVPVDAAPVPVTAAPGPAPAPAEANLPRVLPFADIRRAADGFRLEVDLPGVRAEDLTLDVEGDVLTVRARVRVEFDADKPRRAEEFSARQYVRLFRLGQEVDRHGIEAALRHGVLRLKVPLRAEAGPRRIPVRVEESAPPAV